MSLFLDIKVSQSFPGHSLLIPLVTSKEHQLEYHDRPEMRQNVAL